MTEAMHRGKRAGWNVYMEVTITCANNRFLNNRWEKDVVNFPRQFFDTRYSREEALAYFHSNNDPRGEEIDQELYQRLQKQYENEARNNS
jgi:hypothetical protein